MPSDRIAAAAAAAVASSLGAWTSLQLQDWTTKQTERLLGLGSLKNPGLNMHTRHVYRIQNTEKCNGTEIADNCLVRVQLVS